MRKFLFILRGAQQYIVTHKMRSALTMLGAIFGVGAVIALVAVGQGAQQEVLSQLQSLGSNILVVLPATSFQFSRAGLQENVKTFTNAEVEATEALATSVQTIAPKYRASGTVTYMGATTSPTSMGDRRIRRRPQLGSGARTLHQRTGQ